MISVQQIVEKKIKQTPFLEEGLAKNMINYAGLARSLQSEVSQELMKSVQTGSIIMALRRIQKKILQKRGKEQKIITDITVRSHLKTYTYINSATIAERYAELHFLSRNGLVCNISQGVRETTIVISDELTPKVEKILEKENKVMGITHTSSITLRLTKGTTQTAGVYYMILKLLAWQNINIVEIVSTFQELTIIVDQNDRDKAYLTLSKCTLNENNK